MSETRTPSAEPTDELNREAAAWFARMRGPDAEAARPAFEAWLAQGAGQRSAYNRAAEIFAMGKLLAEDALIPPRRSAKVRATALALCTLSVLAAGGWGVMRVMDSPAQPPQLLAGDAERKETFATIAGETRAIRLADGSLLVLGSDSRVGIEFDSADRRLRLLKGQARFEVAHESRPFVVLAGGGTVTARGTIFDVRLTKTGRVDVRLLEGKIDVTLPHRDGGTSPVRQLRVGEQITFVRTAAAPPAPAQPGPAAAAVRDYHGITVAALVAEANQGAARPIRLADPKLGENRVSGRFRIDDTSLLAERLAALFGSKVDLSEKREVVLTR